MKVAFVGKGGSGKTTLAALFAKECASSAQVLAIDADINQHLGSALELTPEEKALLKPLGLHLTEIKEYLRDKNNRIPSAEKMLKTTPPGKGSRLLSLTAHEPFFNHYGVTKENLTFLAVGAFSEEDLGVKCYHSKTGSVELILNHLVDTKDDVVIVDMTAGADAFASGLFTRFDTTYVIVEPTRKSVEVYLQYREYARKFNVDIQAVGNKIESEEDRIFLEEMIGKPLAFFSRSPHIRDVERGKNAPPPLEPENRTALESLRAYLHSKEKNWVAYLRDAQLFHRKNAESWGNKSTGEDLALQIDETFAYPA